jgi:hypothetical protein
VIATRMRRLAVLVLCAAGCADPAPAVCDDARLPFRTALHCEDELQAQAALPLDTSLPGAITVKTVIDRANGDAVYFQDTEAYPVHSRFAIDQLGWPPGAPFVDQYVTPSRRFLLGSITYYQEPDVFAYELAPYDNADASMIASAYRLLAAATWFGDRLQFHPTSEEQLALALPDDVAVITTDELWAGITYQPLNLGETYAQVHVLAAADLATTYVGPRELVVLDRVPNDLTVVAGVVTEELQTPLSHVNVLSQQRGTPNMGLRDGLDRFTALDGRWVRLPVGAFDWEVAEVTADEADAWWQAHRPPPAQIPAADYTVTALLDVDDVGPADVGAIGGKAANYGVLRDIGGAVRVHDGIVVPASFYRQFLVGNGFDVRIAAMLADPDFRADGNVRKARHAALQADLLAAPVDPDALAAIEARLAQDFPGTRMKFRSSTNAEDLAHHSAAGLYDSRAGQVGDPAHPVDLALKTVWASVWNVRAFEERAYASIDHTAVAMAVLVNASFDGEDANGVAITANVFDPAAGGEDGFFVNAQLGEASVVQPDPGVTADSLMYYWYHPNQPATYYTRSSLVAAGHSVLTRTQLFELGQALDAIRTHFAAFDDPPDGYGQLPMDVEWKLFEGHVWIKQARQYPGRGH